MGSERRGKTLAPRPCWRPQHMQYRGRDGDSDLTGGLRAIGSAAARGEAKPMGGGRPFKGTGVRRCVRPAGPPKMQ